jgi:hypothetical protein
MDMTRRSFLGALLVAIPGVKTLAALAPLKKCEFTIKPLDFPPLILTQFTDDSTTAFWGNRRFDMVHKDGWTWVKCADEKSKSYCEASFILDGESVLLRHVKMVEMKN